jgi:hypothetical protein
MREQGNGKWGLGMEEEGGEGDGGEVVSKTGVRTKVGRRGGKGFWECAHRGEGQEGDMGRGYTRRWRWREVVCVEAERRV